MIRIKILKNFSDAVEKYVRPATLPIAIKMLKEGDRIPASMKRPTVDYGIKLVPCQAFFLSRKYGMHVAMLGEDFYTDQCPVGSIAFGVARPVDWWSKGNVAHEIYTRTMEAAETMEKNMFRFKYGEYAGLASSPLRKAEFVPDMAMVYCNSAQAMPLIAASRYEDGLPLVTTVSARAVCSDSVVQTIQTGRCHVCIPCGGDRIRAFAGADEIVFTAPMSKLQTIAKGLENYHKARAETRSGSRGKLESVIGKKYSKLARILRTSGKSSRHNSIKG